MSKTALTTLAIVLTAAPLWAAEGPSPAKVRAAVDRGLKWLAKQQNRRTGAFSANGGQYPGAMTGLAGMAFLMDGSTLREGRYREQVDMAVEWFLDRARRSGNGLLADTSNPQERSRYMYAQGFGLLFLACVYGEERDGDRRKKLEKVLRQAVSYTEKAQTSQGGWYYYAAVNGRGSDEGSVTITELQALRAARNAGIPVDKKVIDKAVEYLRKSTTPAGGVIYSLARSGRAMNGQERPALTAAAISCSFAAGQYKSEYAKKWIKYCQKAIPITGTIGHDEYTHYYYAQTMYTLGNDRYGELFPGSPEKARLKWDDYRAAKYRQLLGSQQADGSWTRGYVGPVYTTSVNLAILQLEKNLLPIYQR